MYNIGIEILGDTIYHYGMPVAKITINEGSMRDSFISFACHENHIEYQKQIADLEDELNDLENVTVPIDIHDRICEQLEDLENENAELEETINVLTGEIDDLNRELIQLKYELDNKQSLNYGRTDGFFNT